MSHPVRRTWIGRPPHRRAHIETQHPECGWLTRGWIHPAGLDGIHPVWRLADYDHAEAGRIVGDYVTAEKALLDATRALED